MKRDDRYVWSQINEMWFVEVRQPGARKWSLWEIACRETEAKMMKDARRHFGEDAKLRAVRFMRVIPSNYWKR
jgi:hypothetical protein